MPRALFKCVREVSSEDPLHKAENLLKQTAGKSWKTKDVGEQTAYVMLELEKPQKIIGIDIGNENSAFIEVLVGKNASNFTELLITCSFMTPMESRNSENKNRVRCFTQECFEPNAANEQWQMLRIVCTQPFNKHVQYGVAFITLHVAEQVENNEEKAKNPVPDALFERLKATNSQLTKKSVKKFGNFSLREESPDSEAEESLFQRWKIKSHSINESTQSTPTVKEKNNENLEVRDRNRTDLLYGKEPEDKNLSEKQQRLAKEIEKENERSKQTADIELQIQKHKNFNKEKLKPPRSNSDEQPSTSKAAATKSKLKHDAEKTKKRHSSPPTNSAALKKAKTSKIQYRPLNQLLQGVVLVISGIQNPDRADLRSKALAMGAKYRADWDPSCTHLICAFKNTPKYNQVRGQGKIITRSWLEECYNAKKYFPWRRYALDTNDLASAESDEEVWDESLKPVENFTKKVKTPQKSPLKCIDLDEEQNSTNNFVNLTSGSDTEDEIENIRQMNLKKVTKNTKLDEFEATTEEEDYLQEKNKQVGNFFANTKFFICRDVGVVSKIKLETIIKNLGGVTTKKLCESDYALTEEGITDPTDSIGFSGVAVQPRWIYECNDLKTKVSTQRYLI